ncbi:virion structural protein [Erwinia phage PhiEaH1]|uniref:Virion structural protein n=1 Tax=Erwinia phage PhiEaH1 TaxID=1401669 RepID=W8D008_9CAUD|nr:virion structural protein [Erwinia phage PhiEaH1]AGX01930.1 virion structural protein [Erwinia phage PhiEaH1]
MGYKKNKVAPTSVRVKSQNTDFFHRNPRAAVVASKMIADRYSGQNKPGHGVDVPNESIFDVIINRRGRKNLDAETIMNLQPDIKLIKSLITSIVMSPIDMDSGGVTFKMTESTELPGVVYNPLLEVIRSHFTSYYDLNEVLPLAVGEALFDQGASIRVVVPEAAVDDMINGTTQRVSTEDYINSRLDADRLTFRPQGFLGPVMSGWKDNKRIPFDAHAAQKKVSLESAFTIQASATNTRFNSMATITDNIEILTVPILKERTRARMLRNAQMARLYQANRSVATESNQAQIRTLAGTLYKQTNGRSQVKNVEIMSAAHSASRSSIGHPMVMKWSSDSLVPAYVPGEEEKHLGYIGAIDENGHPIDVMEEMKQNISKGMGNLDNQQAMNLTSTLIQQTQILQSGYNVDMDKQSAAERLRLFTQVYEENILNRIKSGIYGHNVKLGDNESFYKVMLARHFANNHIHLVFIPAEQVAYFAYDYDKNGMGKSLLDDVKQVSTLRVMTTFANFMSAIANAVGRTKVTLNIDPRSPDPEKDYHILMDEYLRGQSNASPTDVTSAAEMFRTIRQMGVNFEVTGNDRIPNTTVQVDSYQSQKQMIDPEFTNELKTQQYMGLFVTPDMVDMTQQGDFAITRWTSNQLFAKRIKTIQQATCRHGKKLVTAYTLSSGELIKRLQQEIDGIKDKLPEKYKITESQGNVIRHQELIEDFMEDLMLELPTPSSTKYQTQLEEMNKYSGLLDEGIRHYVTNELLGGAMADEDSSHVDLMVNSIKSYMMREYMAREDILPELQELVRKGTEDNPSLDLSKEYMVHMTNIMNNLGDWGSAVKLRREKYLEMLQSKNPDYAEAIGSAGASADSSSSADSSDDSGDDEFDFDSEPPGMDEFDDGGDTDAEESPDETDTDTTGEADMAAEEEPAQEPAGDTEPTP